MDSFPADLDRATCMRTLEQNQSVLIKDVRKQFTTAITKALEHNEKTILLSFDEKLWDEHCRTIAKELLTLFGKFTAISNPGKYEVKVPLTSASEIPFNLKSIVIDFYP